LTGRGFGRSFSSGLSDVAFPSGNITRKNWRPEELMAFSTTDCLWSHRELDNSIPLLTVTSTVRTLYLAGGILALGNDLVLFNFITISELNILP
jgi:hypothetical protein